MAGHRDAAGRVHGDVETNALPADGSDRSPGFHAIQLSAPAAAKGDITVFGYYAGPAAAITATVRGRPVRAHLARWSVDPTVVLFYFTDGQVRVGQAPEHLTARDRDGARLPAGNTQGGVG